MEDGCEIRKISQVVAKDTITAARKDTGSSFSLTPTVVPQDERLMMREKRRCVDTR